MAFSLSPGINVQEYNISGYVPNLPSSRTGVVIRSNQGPCLDVTSITNENDLVAAFGYPDSSNFQDWFQAWNFLQYASSLYVVRPISETVTNAGLAFIGSQQATPVFKGNLYNFKKAEQTLEAMVQPSQPLTLFKKDITSDQRDAVAICSKPSEYNKQIGYEYYAEFGTPGVATNTLVASTSTLIKGSQVLFNANKLATVLTIDSTTSSVTFDRSDISAADIAEFYFTVTSNSTYFNDVTWQFKAAKSGFNAKVGTYISGTGSASADNYFISGISNADSSNYLVYLTNVLPGTEGNNPNFIATDVITSTDMYYRGTLAVSAAPGDTVLKLANGFVLELGQAINFSGSTDQYIVSNLDVLAGTVTISSPISGTGFPADTLLFNPQGALITIIPNTVLGINFLDQVYDASVIVKTKTVVYDKNGDSKNIFVQSLATFAKLFQYPPNWSNGEFAIVFLVRDKLTNLYKLNTTYVLSYNENAKNKFGSNIFAEQVLMNDSASPVYAKIGDLSTEKPNTASTVLPKFVNDPAGTNIYPQKLTAAGLVYDGYGYTQGDIMEAQDMFSDPETFDINILVAHEKDLNGAATIAETRKDCLAVIVPFDYSFLSTNSANACSEYLTDNFGTQTEKDDKLFSSFGTYSAIYGNMKYQYDKYNDVNRWINIGGDIAGLFAQTDRTNDPWWPAAGSSRGVIKNCIKLAFNPNKQNRDDLYVNGINPIMSVAGEGSAIVWGQKTATAIPSSMDRVNVRRLLIYLEKAIATASRLGLFEFNDAFTRGRLFGIIDQFLRGVKAKRGLYEYKVVIDETNNNSQVIDANGLVIDIYLKPSKVSEFINLNMVVVPTGVSFSEVVGKYGGS